MAPLSTTLAVASFYVMFLAVVIGGAYLFSRATTSAAPVDGSGELAHESGEGSGGYTSRDNDYDQESYPSDVRNAQAYSHYTLLDDTDNDGFWGEN
ncbi:hypothetical protein PG994_002427 [Apiospora phragmitis]|uniref:Uncharacterized protein n=1 Tax=Apiospora phragmitis TaxID=2905665 RepID=A0ABR1WWB9_9PEZI